MDYTTVYSTLLKAFPTFHQEVLTIHSSDILTTKNQEFNFVNPGLFKRSKPKEIILDCLQ